MDAPAGILQANVWKWVETDNVWLLVQKQEDKKKRR